MPKMKKPSRLSKALFQTATDMRHIGILDEQTYAKITMRHLGKGRLVSAEPLTPKGIRSIRERARMSQAVFARHLNLTPGYVSQLERGAKHPTGAALAPPQRDPSQGDRGDSLVCEWDKPVPKQSFC